VHPPKYLVVVAAAAAVKPLSYPVASVLSPLRFRTQSNADALVITANENNNAN